MIVSVCLSVLFDCFQFLLRKLGWKVSSCVIAALRWLPQPLPSFHTPKFSSRSDCFQVVNFSLHIFLQLPFSVQGRWIDFWGSRADCKYSCWGFSTYNLLCPSPLWALELPLHQHQPGCRCGWCCKWPWRILKEVMMSKYFLWLCCCCLWWFLFFIFSCGWLLCV